jgi:hypothetical protein
LVGRRLRTPAHHLRRARWHRDFCAYSELRLNTSADGYLQIGQFANGASIGTSSADATTGALRFVTAGSEKARFDTSGRLGIGTSAPDVVLDVRTGAAGFGQFVHASGLGGVRIAGTGQFSASSLVFANNHSAGVVDGYTIQLDGANQSLKFLSGGTAATARMTLLSDGKVGIGTTSPVQALDVVGSINLTGNHTFSTTTSPLIAATAASSVLRFGTGSGGTERARIDSSGRLLIGTSTARNKFFNTTYTPQLQLEGVGQQQSMFSLVNSVADNGGPVIALGKQRSGTIGGNTIVNSGDNVGHIDFFGSDGTEMVTLAEISARVDGTPGANDMPGRLVFSTTADGAATPTERLRITSAGVLQVADAGDITVGTTTGTKIGTATTQKLGFWDKTPVVQPTTGISGATFDLDTGLSIRTNSTFDGYTIAQVVAALRQLGILA